jgi:hypothetical protein
VYGVPLAEDSALIDASLDLTLGPRTTAGVSYSGQFGDDVQDDAVKGRFTSADGKRAPTARRSSTRLVRGLEPLMPPSILPIQL